MNDTTTGRFRSAADLRREFDASFAAPAASGVIGVLKLLAIRAGDEPLAIRLTDLAGLASRRKVVPLPANEPALLGIAGIQGRLAPVYSLASLLGHDTPEEPRWLAIVGRDEPIALAFPQLEGQLAVAPDTLHILEAKTHRYTREALQLGSGTASAGAGVRYIVDLSSIVTAIRERAGVAALPRQSAQTGSTSS